MYLAGQSVCLSQHKFQNVYPGEIVLLKGFEDATTDEDNIEEGDEFKSKELIEEHKSLHGYRYFNIQQAQTKTISYKRIIQIIIITFVAFM